MDFQNAITVKYSPTDNNTINMIIDNFQKKFECCGYEGYIDWKESSYTETTKELPASCCKEVKTGTCPINDAGVLLEVYQTRVKLHILPCVSGKKSK